MGRLFVGKQTVVWHTRCAVPETEVFDVIAGIVPERYVLCVQRAVCVAFAGSWDSGEVALWQGSEFYPLGIDMVSGKTVDFGVVNPVFVPAGFRVGVRLYDTSGDGDVGVYVYGYLSPVGV